MRHVFPGPLCAAGSGRLMRLPDPDKPQDSGAGRRKHNYTLNVLSHEIYSRISVELQAQAGSNNLQFSTALVRSANAKSLEFGGRDSLQDGTGLLAEVEIPGRYQNFAAHRALERAPRQRIRCPPAGAPLGLRHPGPLALLLATHIP
jgi:hypothetical protein